MSDAVTEYNLTLLRRFAWPGLTKREKRRLMRIDPLLYAAVRGLAERTDSNPTGQGGAGS